MVTFRTPEQRCKKCGATLSGVEEQFGDTRPPRKGDLTICVKCAAILQFEEDLSLSLATAKDLEELKPDEAEALQAARQRVLDFIQRWN